MGNCSWVGVGFAPHFPKKNVKKSTRKKITAGYEDMFATTLILSLPLFSSSSPFRIRNIKKFNLLILSATASGGMGKFCEWESSTFFSYCCCCCCSPLLKNCGAICISIQFCLVNRITQYTVLFFRGGFLCDIRV